MNKNIALIAFLLLTYSYASGQLAEAKMFPYRDGNKWGYCNINGKVLIAPQWDKAFPFGHGKARTEIEDSYGKITCLIDSNGQYIIPPSLRWNGSYTTNSDFDILNIKDTSKHVGRVDTNGKIIIPILYDERGINSTILGGNYYRVFQNGKQGVVRNDGKPILSCSYDEVWHTSPTHISPPAFWVSTGGTLFQSKLLDTNGKELLQFKLAQTPFFQLLDTVNTVYYTVDTTNWLWENYPSGKPRQIPYALEAMNSNDGDVLNGVFKIRVKEKIGFADVHAQILVAPKYDELLGDTGQVLIAQNRLPGNHPNEQYEYFYLDKQTLKLTGKTGKTAQSEIESYLRKKEEQRNFFSHYDVAVERKYVDDILFQEDGRVIYQKGKYFVRINDEVEGSRYFDELAAMGGYVPVSVFDTATKKLIGFTLTDHQLNFTYPPQENYIASVDRFTPNHFLILEKEGQYAVADSNLKIIIGFQPWMIDPRNVIVAENKYMAIATDYDKNSYGTYSGGPIRTRLVAQDGKPIEAFAKYTRIAIMNEETTLGESATQLAVTDPAGLTGIVNLEGKVLYKKVSFRHSYLRYLGKDLFQTAASPRVQLANAKDKVLFPELQISRIDNVVPHYFHATRQNEDPVKGVYILTLDNERFFYINDKGKAFVKDFKF